MESAPYLEPPPDHPRCLSKINNHCICNSYSEFPEAENMRPINPMVRSGGAGSLNPLARRAVGCTVFAQCWHRLSVSALQCAISNASELHYDSFDFAFSSPCVRREKSYGDFREFSVLVGHPARMTVRNLFQPSNLFASDSLSTRSET